MSRTILITGCSSGFGRQLAEQLAKAGDRVYATMRGTMGKNAAVADELRTLATTTSIDLRVLDMDVTSDASVNAAAATVLAESGAPDVIVNNAGQMFVGVTEFFSPAELAEQLDINVVGIHRVNVALLPAMRERGSGLIINLSSIAGRIGLPFFGVYHASKWAVEGYSMALRGELASSGVDVVLVEPGPFTTSLFTGMRTPANAQSLATTYPEVVHQTLEGMNQMFHGLFNDEGTPTDPQMVVDCMIELIHAEPGSRPLRSVVGVDFGVNDRNAAVEPFDTGLLAAAGMTEFVTLRVKK